MAFGTGRRVNRLAVVAGTIRLASGVSFLGATEAANKLWGDDEDSGPTASLLLRSMGYRDGADGADFVGGIANQDRMTDQQKIRGLGGAAAGIGIGLWGAVRAGRG